MMKLTLSMLTVTKAYGFDSRKIWSDELFEAAVANPEPLRLLFEKAYPRVRFSGYTRAVIREIFDYFLSGSDEDEEVERAVRRSNRELVKDAPQGVASGWLNACARCR